MNENYIGVVRIKEEHQHIWRMPGKIVVDFSKTTPERQKAVTWVETRCAELFLANPALEGKIYGYITKIPST